MSTSKTTDDYVAPEVKDLEEKAPTPAKVTTSVPEKSVSYETEEPTVISVASLTGQKGDEVSEALKRRIDQHLKYLAGKEGFSDRAHRDTEQSSFIETVGGFFQLDYPQFAILTDYLLNVVRENPDTFNDGTCFRYLRGLEASYPLDAIRSYREYITLLVMIAKNYGVRYKLNRVIDLGTALRSIPSRKGKENFTTYFNNLMNV